jgi:hypothetical protein
MIRTALQATLLLVLASGALTAQEAPSRLVGTWRIVEFCNVSATGDITHPLGTRPIGFFIYDPNGKLMIQAMRTPHAGAFAADSVPLAGMAEVLESYFGYFGSYTVTSDSTVVHHVTGGTIPSYVGTDQRRDYRIRGDTLSIGASSVPACRRLVRVR